MRRLLIASVVLALTLSPDGMLAAEEEPPPSGSFSPAGSLAEARTEHTAVAVAGGQVLVVGGIAVTVADSMNVEVLASAEFWDPATGTFGPTGSLAEERIGHGATALPDGRVLVVGGWDEDRGRLGSAEIWDPATGAFGPTGSLATPRTAHTATTLTDGRVLVVGGEDDEGFAMAAEAWDPATGTFSAAGSLADARIEHTATALADGRVLVVGGTGGESTSFGPLDSAEIWDPATSTFSPAGSLTGVRRNHRATALTDGRVFVVGGYDGRKLLASAEVWAPATGTFSPTEPLAEARVQHSATALPDGRVLVVGGYNDDGTPASAEVWAPATGTFSRAGSLAEPRFQHSATALPDGRVLVVGGTTTYGPFASAEVWSSGAGSTTAQSPAASPDAAGQRVELPGYGVSIIVPEHWTTDLWGNSGFLLHPGSRLYEDLSVVATGGPEAQQCRVTASSPATCDAPVDLSAELAAPGWDPVQLPAGEAAYQALDPSETPAVACSRYVLSDGLDAYELRCCGSDRPADAWRPIADSFTFPEQSRWDSPDADGRDLLEEVGVVWQKQGVWPAGSIYGSGETQTAKQWINRPRNKLSRGEIAAIRAMVDVLGVPAKRVTIGTRFYESDSGEVLLAVDDVRVPGFPTEVVLDGLLAWLADDWERRYEDAPTFEEMDIGGREVLALTFGADDPTEYILASGDTAMRVRGADTEAAVTMLETLSCRHLDVSSLVLDYLVERTSRRSSGTDE